MGSYTGPEEDDPYAVGPSPGNTRDRSRFSSKDKLSLSFNESGAERDEELVLQAQMRDRIRQLEGNVAKLEALDAQRIEYRRELISAAAEANRASFAPITVEVSGLVADIGVGVGHGLQNLALGAAEPMLQVADVMQASLKMLHGSVTGDYESLTPLSGMGAQLGETGGGTSDGLLITGKNVVSMLPPVAAAQVGWGVGSSLYKGDVAGVTENVVGGAAVFGGARAAGLGQYGFREVPVSSMGTMGRQRGAIGLEPFGPERSTTYKFGEKPKNSPDLNKWVKKGGSVWSELDGTWVYKDVEGNVVRYPNGFPDYKGAGFVRQEVKIETVPDHYYDFKNADQSAPLGPKQPENTWHHHEDGATMQEINMIIHNRFTHRGGVSTKKRG